MAVATLLGSMLPPVALSSLLLLLLLLLADVVCCCCWTVEVFFDAGADELSKPNSLDDGDTFMMAAVPVAESTQTSSLRAHEINTVGTINIHLCTLCKISTHLRYGRRFRVAQYHIAAKRPSMRPNLHA